MIQKIKCFIGWHSWQYGRMPCSMREFRMCVECRHKEHLEEIVIKNWE